MKSLKLALAAAGLIVLMGARADAQTAVFDFDSLVPGDVPSGFALVDNGVTATFTYTDPAEVYGVVSNTVPPTPDLYGSPPISGNLFHGGNTTFPAPTDTTLTITFSGAPSFTDLGLDFITIEGDTLLTAPVVMASFDGGALVPFAPLGPGGTLGYGQGFLGHVGPFSSVALTISGINPSLGIDNVAVTAVPEPGTWAFLLGGLVPLALRLRRRA